MKKILLPITLTSLLLTSCAGVNNEGTGALTGGIVGGLIGSQFGGNSGKVLAAGGGALLGSYLGGRIGQYMDRVDRMEMQRALETAPTGKAVRWKNPDNGNEFTVKPTKTYYADNQPCREYVTNALIGGKPAQIYGKACRSRDGAWRVVS